MRASRTPSGESGLDWTMLRPGGFALQRLRLGRVGPRRSGRSRRRSVTSALPAIDPADIAEVAAVALREDGHAGQVYELTGPAPISPRQQAAAIGDALGEPVRFVEQTRDEARAQMLRFMPEPVVEATLAILGEPDRRRAAGQPRRRAGPRPPAPHLRRLGPPQRRRLPGVTGAGAMRTGQ